MKTSPEDLAERLKLPALYHIHNGSAGTSTEKLAGQLVDADSGVLQQLLTEPGIEDLTLDQLAEQLSGSSRVLDLTLTKLESEGLIWGTGRYWRLTERGDEFLKGQSTEALQALTDKPIVWPS